MLVGAVAFLLVLAAAHQLGFLSPGPRDAADARMWFRGTIERVERETKEPVKPTPHDNGKTREYPDLSTEIHVDGIVFTLCGRRAMNCVIDGDTIRYRGMHIRIDDIDAPEIFSPSCDAEREIGEHAKLRLLEVVNAAPFEIVFSDHDHDRYGRELRHLVRNGQSLGSVLVDEGLARRWNDPRRSWC